MIQPDERKVHLMYLLPRYDAASPEHVFHLYGFLRQLQKRIPVQVLVERMKGTIPEDLPARGLWIQYPPLRFLEELFRFLAARLRGVRVFYVHYSYTGAIAASLVTRLLGGKTYYWNCSLYAMFRPAGEAGVGQRLRYVWNTFLLETAVRGCSHLVTGTPRMARYYSAQAGIRLDSIRVLPNFIDWERFQGIDRMEARARLGVDPSRSVVLFLHRIAPRKGAHFLPEILRELARTNSALTLIVAGGGPYLPELRRRMEQEGLSHWVDFRDWVSNRDVPLYFHAADLYIMPSVEEGFPRVLLESMAAGCPFVAFAVGGVRDILSNRQQECVVEAGDVPGFAAACVRALESKVLRESWRSAGEDQVKRFSQDKVLEVFLRMVGGDEMRSSEFFPEGRLP